MTDSTLFYFKGSSMAGLRLTSRKELDKLIAKGLVKDTDTAIKAIRKPRKQTHQSAALICPIPPLEPAHVL